MPLDEATKTHLFTHDGPDVPGCEHCDAREPLALIHGIWRTGTAEQRALIWSLQDGYGEPGLVPEQGYDWSGIRDSTPAAIWAIHKALGLAPSKCIECDGPIDSLLPTPYCGPKCSGMLG